ncbi:hypothetical protein FRACYDRAFT_188136, partial [Fragilariopsis cylindrus CCMP1102]
NTAFDVVKKVFPSSQIIENRVNKYPIRVIITAHTSDDDDAVEIWSGRQQDLFSKYKSKRINAMKEINASLEGLKKSIMS